MKVDQNTQPLLLKIGVVGDYGVGKTSLITRLIDNQFIQKSYCSLGIQFKIKKYQIGKIAAKVQFWDVRPTGMMGSERFKTGNNFFSKLHAICICFSLSNRNSFDSLGLWIDEMREINHQAAFYLIGCKSDELPQVSTHEVIVFSQAYSIVRYIHTSAKNSVGIADPFQEIVQETALRRLYELSKEEEQKKIIPVKKQSFFEKNKCY